MTFLKYDVFKNWDTDKTWCCKGTEENCRKPIYKGYFSQHSHGNASGMPSNYTDLGGAGILQALSTQVSFEVILYLIEQVKGVVSGSDRSLLCEDTQMISFT